MKFRFAFFTALSFCACPVFAQSPAVKTDPIVVTATRTARTADETLAAVSVITRADIERRQSQDLVDLLRTEAGIDIARSGGPGGNVDLFMRGGNQEHVLVFVDGVRVSSATTGSFEWRSLPVVQIERIEIVRGPRASLYGSDAIAGVIQIFTRRPDAPEASVMAGSNAARRVSASWGNKGSTRTFVTATHFQTDGFSSQNSNGSSFNPDDDGAKEQAMLAGVQFDVGQSARVEIAGRQSRGWAEYDPLAGAGLTDIVNESFSANLTHTVSSWWTHSLKLGTLTDDLLDHSSFASHIRTTRRTADWQNDFTIDADSWLTVGWAYFEEFGSNINLAANTVEFDKRQDDRAVFALWQKRLGDTDVQLSGRYDDYSTFGSHGTWGAAIGHLLTTNLRVWSSYGTAFHAPTLNDLYHPGFGIFGYAGNPDLKPERSKTAEIGIKYRNDTGHRSAITFFHTKVDELISSQGANNQSINVDEAILSGVELEYGYSANDWHISGAFTRQRADDASTGAPLIWRAKRKLTGLIERRFEAGALGLELVASSARPDLGGRETDGYGVLNLAARYRLHKNLLLEGRIENLLDKEYQIINGYNTPDRSLFVSLRYSPNL